jgi:hypothetical protein
MPEKARNRSVSLPAFCVRLVSLLVVAGAAALVFLANPINWKLYDQFRTIDWLWAFVSNIGILVAAAAGWWFGQKKLTQIIERKKDA